MSAEPTLLPLDQPSPAQPAIGGERRSLYRAYRSLTFDEVAGQGHVTVTLKNAVRYGTVAHAYLFTGPRGTGKTSTARILARAVNCLQPRDGEPCNQCPMCLGMLERRALDLVEIDGASNNSVDDVRELRERVNFRPAEARRKVFIIDEVHMLSIGAFNALLKTLEEPPDHVLFLLATTELHKVPATVSSRCQIFALRPIPAPDVVERLRYVCSREGMQADDQVLRFITTQSTGSLRDALSLLEQIRAYCGDVLLLSEVEAALGVARVGQVALLADAMAAGDLGTALQTVGDLAESGVDPRQLARQLAGYWRDALLGRARKQKVAEPHVAACGADAIALVLRVLLSVESSTRRSDSPRWALELAIVEATLALGGSASTTEMSGPATAYTARPPESASPARNGVAPSPIPAGGSPLDGIPATSSEPLSAAVPPLVLPAAVMTDRSAHAIGVEIAVVSSPAPEAAPLTAESLSEDRTEAVSSGPAPGTEKVREQWPQVMRWLREQQKRLVFGALQQVTSGAISVGDGVVTIGFPPALNLMKHQLDSPKNQQVVAQALAAVLGGQWGVRYVTIDAMPAPTSADRLSDQDYVDSIAAQASARARHPIG